MLKIQMTSTFQGASIMTALVFIVAISAFTANAQAPAASGVVGDAARGEEHFEATCAECHGAAATAPTLRGVINRPIGSVESFTGYSEAMKAKKSMTWTKENLNTYLKSPPTFVPGNYMYREFPDAQMRADIIAFLETLPPPK